MISSNSKILLLVTIWESSSWPTSPSHFTKTFHIAHLALIMHISSTLSLPLTVLVFSGGTITSGAMLVGLLLSETFMNVQQLMAIVLFTKMLL